MLSIPSSFRSGDLIKWVDRDLNFFDPVTKELRPIKFTTHSLSYLLRGKFNLGFLATAVDGEEGAFLTTIDPIALSILIPAGFYGWQGFVTDFDNNQRLTLGSGVLEILPNLLEINDPYDPRSLEEKELEAVNAAIVAVLKDGVAEYEIKGRKATFLDLDALRALRSELSHKIAREKKRKLGKGNNVKIRFN